MRSWKTKLDADGFGQAKIDTVMVFSCELTPLRRTTDVTLAGEKSFSQFRDSGTPGPGDLA